MRFLPAAAPPPEPDQPLDLIGVLLIPGAAAALLRPTELKIKDPTKTNAKVLRVAQGEKVDGWELQSVNADKVVLRKNGEIRELLLLRPPTPTRATAPGDSGFTSSGASGNRSAANGAWTSRSIPRIISPPAAPESVAPPQEMLPPL
ncbi:MAG: hypothetical protein H6975_09320 [Gammaproteobacteria bacterium]|nr:hypothetical protein [Gammaproteobacteria bacterium]